MVIPHSNLSCPLAWLPNNLGWDARGALAPAGIFNIMRVNMYNHSLNSLSGRQEQPVTTAAATSSWVWTIVLLSISYVSLCHALRFRRYKKICARYNYPDRASLSRMTNNDAHAIINNIASYDFPLLYDIALRFTLFRTYTIASIASVVGLSDLGKSKLAPKRYEDTSIVYECFTAYPPNSPLLHKAIGRINYLHAPYVKKNLITNRDMVYVIFASILEPVRFIKLYEWRELSEMEIAALGTVWKYIGEMMDIDFAAELGKDKWTDGIEFFEDLRKWSIPFEANYMRHTADVQKLGAGSVNLLLSSYPKFARSTVYKMFLTLMGDRMRHAFGLEEPSIATITLTYGLVWLRKTVLRYLCLPRISPINYLKQSATDSERLEHHRYLKEPWYNPPTFWSRWSPEALFIWATGGHIPGERGANMMTEGFRFEDIGPRRKMGKGAEEGARFAAMARKKASGGCPFAMS